MQLSMFGMALCVFMLVNTIEVHSTPVDLKPALDTCPAISEAVLVDLTTPRPDTENPCVPISPCGPNSVCKASGTRAVCTCQAGMLGVAPACRPECLINDDCIPSEACINKKCKDPCAGVCGDNANCRVINHNTNCYCKAGYFGDAFEGCKPAVPDHYYAYAGFSTQ